MRVIVQLLSNNIGKLKVISMKIEANSFNQSANMLCLVSNSAGMRCNFSNFFIKGINFIFKIGCRVFNTSYTLKTLKQTEIKHILRRWLAQTFVCTRCSPANYCS